MYSERKLLNFDFCCDFFMHLISLHPIFQRDVVQYFCICYGMLLSV